MNLLSFLGLTFAVIPLAAVWSGYVLSMLWSWLIIPTFPMMPALSIPAAIGVSVVVGSLTHQTRKSDAEEDWSFLITKMFLMPLISLLVGLVVKQFI